MKYGVLFITLLVLPYTFVSAQAPETSESTTSEQVKSLQPNCIVIGNNSRNLKTTDIYSYELPVYKGKTIEDLVAADNTMATEICDTLGPAWFWNEDRHWSPERRDESKLLSVEEVLNRLNTCNTRNANYLLNAGPNNHGLLPASTVQRLKEIGEARKRAVGN